MKIVGYLEGTDPTFLTKITAKGIGTLPLSNGADNHGKYIVHLTKKDNISLVVGYFHKVIPPLAEDVSTMDLLYSCKIHDISVILIAPTEVHKDCKKILKDLSRDITLVDPKDLFKEATSRLKS